MKPNSEEKTQRSFSTSSEVNETLISIEDSLPQSEFDKNFDEYVKKEVQTQSDTIYIFFSFCLDFAKKFLPVSIVYLIYIMINVINILFVSHSEFSKTNKELIYAVNLGLSLYYMLGISLCFGISSSLDTFCTNSFGAKLYYLMGCYLNRALVIMTMIYIPTALGMFFLKDILFSMGQDELVAIHAGNFIRGMLPGMLFFYWTDSCRRFMQAQGVFIPTIFIVLVTSLLHPLWVYLFFNVLEMGAFGNGLACSVTNFLNFILMMIVIKKWAVTDSFFFPNRDAFVGWKEFFSLAFPSMLMICLETWNYQIINFMVGYLKDSSEENTNSYLISFSSIIYMFPFGLSVASSNILGRYIGDFSPRKAQHATRFIIVICIIISSLICIILLIFKNYVPYIYTQDSQEIKLMQKYLWLYIFYEFVEVLTTSYAGIYRGLGMQVIIALANFVCYYLISIPLTILLTFVFEMRLDGVWSAYVISIISLILFYAVIHINKVDYYKICKETNKRLSRDSFIISQSKDFDTKSILDQSLDSIYEQGASSRRTSTGIN
jgi:MATE family multidrug resistance protein